MGPGKGTPSVLWTDPSPARVRLPGTLSDTDRGHDSQSALTALNLFSERLNVP